MGVPKLDEELLPEDEIPNVNESDDTSYQAVKKVLLGMRLPIKYGFTSVMFIWDFYHC